MNGRVQGQSARLVGAITKGATMPFGLTRKITEPRITGEGELRRYVLRITTFALAIALTVDTAQQLAFFIDWQHFVRSLILTTGVVSAISVPVTLSIGRAHLNLFLQKQELERLSLTDPLTGLPNRRALMEAGEAHTSTYLVLVIVDVDRFKRINDTFGHRVGDVALQTVAMTMAANLNSLGLVGRLGGEEFALITSEPSVDMIVERVARFREHIANLPVIVDRAAVTVTISAGIAVREGGESPIELYTQADEALYAAKLAGRNCIRLSPALAAKCSPATLRLIEKQGGALAS